MILSGSETGASLCWRRAERTNWLAIVGSPILLAHMVLAASAEVRIEGLLSRTNGLLGHGRTEPVRVSVGMPGVVVQSGRVQVRPELCRV